MDVKSFLTAANLKNAAAIGVGLALYFRFVKPYADKYIAG
jgi:hypothetical protein